MRLVTPANHAAAEVARLVRSDSAGLSSLPDQIANRLAARIIDGRYSPGQKLGEQSLSHELGVSRGPVREALRILEKEGLVVILPRRGAQVTRLSIEEVRDIFDIRVALTGLAARLIAERADDAMLARIRDHVKALSKIARDGGDVDTYTAHSFQLSQILAEGSDNSRLRSMLASLARQTVRYSQLGLSSQARRRESAAHWRRLLDALETGDPGSAAEIASVLVSQSRDMAIRRLREEAQSSAQH